MAKRKQKENTSPVLTKRTRGEKLVFAVVFLIFTLYALSADLSVRMDVYQFSQRLFGIFGRKSLCSAEEAAVLQLHRRVRVAGIGRRNDIFRYDLQQRMVYLPRLVPGRIHVLRDGVLPVQIRIQSAEIYLFGRHFLYDDPHRRVDGRVL